MGAAAGAIASSLITYYLIKIGRRSEAISTKPQTPEHPLIPPEKIKEAKKELRILKMEKELLTSALVKIYEAEAQGRIGREEREILVKKYKEKLQELQDRISHTTTLVEFSELENVRGEILRLMNAKLSQIEKRLEELKDKMGTIISSVPEVKEEKAGRRTEKEGSRERREKTEEDRWGKIIEEVNEVLARLEQIETE